MGLDAVVTRIAVRLMSASSASLGESLDWALRLLNEFFEVDTSFVRRTDFTREMSVLVAEWPPRSNVPDPDPLGEVLYGADPIFDAVRDLKEPFVMRPSGSPDAYQDRVEQGAGVSGVSMAMVPLIQQLDTVGVLGFVKFGDRSWDVAETNGLQAVASLIVNLQSRIEAEERLRYQAEHDELTDLANRRALLEEIRFRPGPEMAASLGLVLFNIDRFKALNSSLGQLAGDQFLIATADRLLGTTRSTAFVARLAADEFVLVLRGSSVSEARAIAARALDLLQGNVDIGGHQVSRTASAGMSFAPSGAEGEQLLAQADAALRLAKLRGGNQIVAFDRQLDDATRERADTEVLLRHAIHHGGLLLHYQPEVDLRSGALLAVEALVRWNHPDRGLLAAGSFIEVAEECGLIGDLGWWVLNEACRQMAVWRRQHPSRQFVMRVNISPAQLAIPNIVQLVETCLARHELAGELLCLEITEHAVVHDVDESVEILRGLKALGITLAIDDFGTGYSSMSQLKGLPVDALKIDQTFVAGLGTDAGDEAIVDATIHLARSFGLEVIAEGVETMALLEHLLALGCERAQGFLLCKPKPAAELAALLAAGGIDLDYVAHHPLLPHPL
jgi:diguanylate cyclase (GGDEF)-like protein